MWRHQQPQHPIQRPKKTSHFDVSLSMDANRLIIDECRAGMRTLPAGCVQCCVTSPPYWGLRDYGIAPVEWESGPPCVFGLEPTPELFVQHAVEVFRDVRRILRDDGVLFLNLGDSYNAFNGGAGPSSALSVRQSSERPDLPTGYGLKNKSLKPGDLCNIPHRVAAALQADGWYWRSTIIWSKRSPMPESISGWRWVRCRVKVAAAVFNAERNQPGRNGVNDGHRDCGSFSSEQNKTKWQPCPGCDKCRSTGGLILRRGKWRPTTAHEYVFMLSKSERYFADGDAVQELATSNRPDMRAKGVRTGTGYLQQSAVASNSVGNVDRAGPTIADLDHLGSTETRNPRSVWTLSSEPYKGAHFATFPTMLAKRCIEAGTSAGGCCPSCGSCYAPVVESQRIPTRPALNNKIWKHSESGDVIQQRSQSAPNLDPERHIAITRVTGYRSTCACNAEPAVGCVVFDPFSGSGTTLQVARALGRQWVGTEINPEYAKLAEVRIATEPKWRTARPKQKRRKPNVQQRQLFT